MVKKIISLDDKREQKAREERQKIIKRIIKRAEKLKW